MSTDQYGIFQNPYLDPYLNIIGGKSSVVGQPLVPLSIPPIQTLLTKKGKPHGSLSMVQVTDTLIRAGIVPEEPIQIKEESVGIELNLNLYGVATEPVGETSNLEAGKTLGKSIPKDFREARNALQLIVPSRSGSKNTAFNIGELRQIARNLNLPSSGNKEAIANRIRTAVIAFYGDAQ
jgi:hypothetical protein